RPNAVRWDSAARLLYAALAVVAVAPWVFRFSAAAARPDVPALVTDQAGALIDADIEGVVELDPVEKLVAADADHPAGQLVPIRLESHVTEAGTLELWCVARDGRGRWKLEYSVRERDAATAR